MKKKNHQTKCGECGKYLQKNPPCNECDWYATKPSGYTAIKTIIDEFSEDFGPGTENLSSVIDNFQDMQITTMGFWDNKKDDIWNDWDPLEKKYGKEPKISKEELKKSRWEWH